MDLSSFKRYISSKPCIVYFTATWCGPCKNISPIFDELNNKAPEEMYFIKVDIDEYPDIEDFCNISIIPSCLFYHNGKLLKGYRFEGVHETQLRAGYKHLLSLL